MQPLKTWIFWTFRMKGMASSPLSNVCIRSSGAFLTSVINLEHILPKKPDVNWPRFSEEEVGVSVNRLGNQALMRASDNSDLKSAMFADKKQTYSSSPYVLTSEIGDLDKWNADSVAVRQKSLTQLAVSAWPI